MASGLYRVLLILKSSYLSNKILICISVVFNIPLIHFRLGAAHFFRLDSFLSLDIAEAAGRDHFLQLLHTYLATDHALIQTGAVLREGRLDLGARRKNYSGGPPILKCIARWRQRHCGVFYKWFLAVVAPLSKSVLCEINLDVGNFVEAV